MPNESGVRDAVGAPINVSDDLAVDEDDFGTLHATARRLGMHDDTAVDPFRR